MIDAYGREQKKEGVAVPFGKVHSSCADGIWAWFEGDCGRLTSPRASWHGSRPQRGGGSVPARRTARSSTKPCALQAQRFSAAGGEEPAVGPSENHSKMLMPWR